ncbi:MAG: YncE family protein, partial [Streptosporangiaceae bacterium]
VTPISVATNTAGRPIPAGREPGAMAITPDGKTLYVADVGSDTVTPISVATNTAGPRITVGPAPDEIVITPDGKRAYVLCVGSGGRQQNGTVLLIATATDTARRVATIAGATFGQMVLAP